MNLILGEKYGEYTAIYQVSNNYCYEILGTNSEQGAGDRVIRRWVINHKYFRRIILEEATFDGIGIRPWLQANIFREGVNYFFYSPVNNGRINCNKINPQEASKIIRSLRILNS